MALINCSECNNQVSDKAEACPKCGNPISGKAEAEAIGTTVTTVQGTSKKLKLHTLLASLLVIGGCSAMVSSVNSPTGSGGTLGTWVMILGMIWYITARVRSWWHHG